MNRAVLPDASPAPAADPTGRVSVGLAAATHPVVYEINTWPWLHELTRTLGRPVDLGSVPDRAGTSWRAWGSTRSG